MKILYQHRTLADGAEGVHIAEMINAFRALGHTVTVHALATPEARGRGRLGFHGRVKQILPKAVFEVLTLAYNLVEWVSFGRALRRYKPDLVYKRHAMYDVGVGMATRRAQIPLVLEINRSYSSPHHRRFEPVCFPGLVRVCEKVALASATLAVAISTPLREALAPLCAESCRVLVIPNGANPDRFDGGCARRDELRARYDLGPSVVAGWAGILREWHGVELLLEALVDIPENLRLLVIGDGPDRHRLEEVIARLGLGPRVIFTGRVAHDEMRDYLSAIDIGVVAHDGTGIASPMKALEYMAMGRPIVAPRLPSIEDFVDDNRDGLLFTPGDPAHLATTLTRLASDPSLRNRLGRNARAKVEHQRNWQNNAALILGALPFEDSGVSEPPPLPHIHEPWR